MRLSATTANAPLELVSGSNFIRATRDAGYRNTTAAVAELIDNAIQADAHVINVFVRESTSADGRAISLAVQDDGSGMSPETLRRALQFGGTSRFEDRSGLGRYGMGLPNSSVSQARRLEVVSWQSSRSVWGCHLDVDELVEEDALGIPMAYVSSIPDWAAKHSTTHGTLVLWSRCDRFCVKKAITLAERLRAALGRVYRRKLWEGLQVYVNEALVQPSDPLFAHPETGEGGGSSFGPPLLYAITVPGTRRRTTVIVRFVELPVAEWYGLGAAEKRSREIVGGAGVSILRAGREIDFGWHFMGAKRRENYDDWWRCEVSFEPEADELFGVTHTKQGIRPSGLLRAILAPDIESIARTLNARVRHAFERAKRAAEGSAASSASAKDVFLPTIGLPPGTFVVSDHFEYRVRLAQLSSSALFAVMRRGNVITVSLNNEHPFVAREYSPTRPNDQNQRRDAIERLVIAAARARLSCSSEEAREAVDRYLGEWSDVLAAFSER